MQHQFAAYKILFVNVILWWMINHNSQVIVIYDVQKASYQFPCH